MLAEAPPVTPRLGITQRPQLRLRAACALPLQQFQARRECPHGCRWSAHPPRLRFRHWRSPLLARQCLMPATLLPGDCGLARPQISASATFHLVRTAGPQTLPPPRQTRLHGRHQASATPPAPPAPRLCPIVLRPLQSLPLVRYCAPPDCKALRQASHAPVSCRTQPQFPPALSPVHTRNPQPPLLAASFPAARNWRDPDTLDAPRWPPSSAVPAQSLSSWCVRHLHGRRTPHS